MVVQQASEQLDELVAFGRGERCEECVLEVVEDHVQAIQVTAAPGEIVMTLRRRSAGSGARSTRSRSASSLSTPTMSLR